MCSPSTGRLGQERWELRPVGLTWWVSASKPKRNTNKNLTVRNPEGVSVSPDINENSLIGKKQKASFGRKMPKAGHHGLLRVSFFFSKKKKKSYCYNESNKHSIGIKKYKFQKTYTSVQDLANRGLIPA